MSLRAQPDTALELREVFLAEMIREAGALADDAFRGGASFRMKGPQDFLTATDEAVEKLLRERIAGSFPQDGFLGEETGGDAGSEGFWVADPIDGTANFARRIPHYCISVAFVRGGRTQLGAIYDPSHDELYLARHAGGASRNGELIQVSRTHEFACACVEFGWSTRVPTRRYIATVEVLLEAGANVRRGASGALGLAHVADGRSDAYGEHHMNPWDCLAGLLLVEEAGGAVCDYPSGRALAGGGPVLAVAPGLARRMSEATCIPLKASC